MNPDMPIIDGSSTLYNPTFNITIMYSNYNSLSRVINEPDRAKRIEVGEGGIYRGDKPALAALGASGVGLVAIKNANTPDQKKELILWWVDEDLSEKELEKKIKSVIKNDKTFTYLTLHVNRKNVDEEVVKLYATINELAQKILNDSDPSISSTPLQKLFFDSSYNRADMGFFLDLNGGLLIYSKQKEGNDFPNVYNKNRVDDYPFNAKDFQSIFKENEFEIFALHDEKGNLILDEKGHKILPKNRQELKKSYFELALKYHPDKNGNSQSSTEAFQNLNELYVVFDNILNSLDHEMKE